MTELSASSRADTRRAPGEWPPGLELVAFSICVALAVYLAASYAFGQWLLGPDGERIVSDFVGFWSAGRLVLDGQSAAVYDPVAHKAASVAALGHGFAGAYPFNYPPPYLLVAALFASLPYTLSYIVWVALTALLYMSAVSRLIGYPGSILLAAAFPPLLANAIVGQNGCLTAALFGGALLAIERRPVLAGVLLGLLTYKPHFGILIPLALICGRQWCVLTAATLSAIALVLISWLALGTSAWDGFFRAIVAANYDTLSSGSADWGKQQTVFGLARVLGASAGSAYVLQGVAIAGMACWVGLAWSGRQPFAMKAAILSVGAVIAAPYSYMYDTVLLAVPAALLLRDGRDRGFLPGEMAGLGGICFLLTIFPFAKAPVAVGAAFILAGLLARRWLALPPLRHAAAFA